jgi:hypothetical protein
LKSSEIPTSISEQETETVPQLRFNGLFVEQKDAITREGTSALTRYRVRDKRIVFLMEPQTRIPLSKKKISKAPITLVFAYRSAAEKAPQSKRCGSGDGCHDAKNLAVYTTLILTFDYYPKSTP